MGSPWNDPAHRSSHPLRPSAGGRADQLRHADFRCRRALHDRGRVADDGNPVLLPA
ncbi:hypothetical protein R2601_03358 [Salipiger bermudensis HTCC2601]|uniref:Uncharacterized protein n=1 Tax=Salipiger bermudensis (strain DSM 26914 / JCM 13377 / KCTC 12554 / HTCC2601) TaxID=314265 RepID=Q0FWH4_SALBH|nr:hypothetical protein R2601_03358 [Salipiger bermudensis HTCC2601]